MAIIKFINSKTRLETLINYVTKKSKVFAVDGKDCLADSALDEMVSVKIDPSVVDADDVEMLEDLLVASYNDAKSKVDDAKNSKLGAFGGLM